jgi:hypothetical protein
MEINIKKFIIIKAIVYLFTTFVVFCFLFIMLKLSVNNATLRLIKFDINVQEY